MRSEQIEGAALGRKEITYDVSEAAATNLQRTVGVAAERGYSVARSMKRWTWRSVLYCVAMLSGALAGPLFGDTGRLTAIAACVAFFIWYAWKRTKFQPSFLEAVAGLFPPRERRFLLGLLVLMVLLAMLVALPAIYYLGATGAVIASGVALVAGSVFAWRARRSARVSAGSQHGEPSPSNGEPGTG